MSEKDIVTGIIVDFTPQSSSVSTSTTIIFSKRENLGQFGNVAQSITTAELKKGIRISMDVITNATYTTGDIAVTLNQYSPLPQTLESQETGVVTNEKGTVTWQGKNRWVITDIEFPVNPITGEPLPLPAQTSVLGNAAITEAVVASPTTSVSTYENPANVTTSNGFVTELSNVQLEEAKRAK